MDVLSHKQLCDLMADRPGPCVSIYLPTQRTARAIEENRRRFLEQLGQVREKLRHATCTAAERERVCQQMEAVHADHAFWQQVSQGLTLFCTPNDRHAFRLPIDFQPQVAVDTWFHVLPLVPYVQGVDRLYLLSLGKDVVRLYHADQHSICELYTVDFPMRMHLLPLGDEPYDYRRNGSSTMTKANGRASMAELCKSNLFRAFRLIDQAVRRALQDQRAPLVLASIGYLASLYESINSYSNLAQGKVPGNPELWTVDELQSRAWRLVQPWFKKRQEDTLAAYGRAARGELTTTDLAAVVVAADQGQIETLFWANGTEQKGSFDRQRKTVQLGSALVDGEEDLLDFAAARTLAHGGTVIPLRPDALPSNAPLVAAILRSAAPR